MRTERIEAPGLGLFNPGRRCLRDNLIDPCPVQEFRQRRVVERFDIVYITSSPIARHASWLRDREIQDDAGSDWALLPIAHPALRSRIVLLYDREAAYRPDNMRIHVDQALLRWKLYATAQCVADDIEQKWKIPAMSGGSDPETTRKRFCRPPFESPWPPPRLVE